MTIMDLDSVKTLEDFEKNWEKAVQPCPNKVRTYKNKKPFFRCIAELEQENNQYVAYIRYFLTKHNDYEYIMDLYNKKGGDEQKKKNQEKKK